MRFCSSSLLVGISLFWYFGCPCQSFDMMHHREQGFSGINGNSIPPRINTRLQQIKNIQGIVNNDDCVDHCKKANSRRFVLQKTFTSLLTVTTTTTIMTNPKTAASATTTTTTNERSRTDGYPIKKTPSEWHEILSPLQYDILRNGGTERPYSSILENEKRNGIFICAGCGTPLFESSQKFKSGTGWPSFAKPIESGVEVEQVNMLQANLAGAELRCKSCGGHLGDVFTDGFLFVGTPAFVTGKRYCIDGAALLFQPNDTNEPIVRGDMPPPSRTSSGVPSTPSWLEPPKITPREIEQ